MSSECVKVPHLHYLHHQRLSETDIFAQTWTMIVTYFAPEHFVQHQNLTFERGLVMVTGLARFHAYFWGKTTGKFRFTAAPYRRGGYHRKETSPCHRVLTASLHPLPLMERRCSRRSIRPVPTRWLVAQGPAPVSEIPYPPRGVRVVLSKLQGGVRVH